jgi:hypothetical protein
MLLILEKYSIKLIIDYKQLCCQDLSTYLVLKAAIKLNY